MKKSNPTPIDKRWWEDYQLDIRFNVVTVKLPHSPTRNRIDFIFLDAEQSQTMFNLLQALFSGVAQYHEHYLKQLLDQSPKV